MSEALREAYDAAEAVIALMVDQRLYVAPNDVAKIDGRIAALKRLWDARAALAATVPARPQRDPEIEKLLEGLPPASCICMTPSEIPPEWTFCAFCGRRL